jgi:hypothetical protein
LLLGDRCDAPLCPELDLECPVRLPLFRDAADACVATDNAIAKPRKQVINVFMP